MLRFKTKTFTNKEDRKSVYRYYLIDDLCSITGLTPRQVFVKFPYKGIQNLGGSQCLDVSGVRVLCEDYPALNEAIETAEEIPHG